MAEFVDLVNGNGQVQKRNVPRSEAGKHSGLYMQIVIVVILDNRGRLLVHRRAKEPNIGSFDHVCGGIISGETPEEAAAREAFEETSIKPHDLRLITASINEYNRYRYLLVGTCDDKEPVGDPHEVQWVGYMYLEELRSAQLSGESTFVDGFFEDIEQALV